MIDYFSKRPMLTCAVLATVICVMGFYSRAALFICGITLILILFFLIYKSRKLKYSIIIFILIAISVSMLSEIIKADKLLNERGKTASGEFVVVSEVVDRVSIHTATVEAKDCDRLKKGTKITVYSYEQGYAFGDIITADIVLDEIDDKYKAGYYADGIYLSGFIDSFSLLDETEPILDFINKIRNYISDSISDNMGKREAGTLIAIVFGDMSYMSDRFYDNVKSAGVSHTLVVSGMHLAILVGFMTKLTEKLLYNRFLKALIIFFTVLVVLVICGFTKSIVRAAICYIIYAFAVALNCNNNSENTLGAAVCFMYLLEPFTVFSISFELSVLATLGIVVAANPTSEYIDRKKIINRKLSKKLFSEIAVNIYAMLFTLPVIIYIFGYTSIVALPANLLISSAISAALSFSAAGLCIYAVIPILGEPLVKLAGLLTKYINAVINYFGSLPFATIDLGKADFIASVIVLLFIIGGLFAVRKYEERLLKRAVNDKVIRETKRKIKWE